MNRQCCCAPGILLINLSRDDSQIRSHLVDRSASLHPSQQREPTSIIFMEKVTVGLQRLLHRHRRPKFAGPRIQPAKSGRGDSNHRELRAIQRNTFPHNQRISAESAPPQIVAQHHHGGRSRCATVRIHKYAPQRWPPPQNAKIVAGRSRSH